MRNALYIAAFTLLLLFGIQRIRLALESDEEAIARRLQVMARGFNETTMRHALGGFDRRYQDEATGHDKRVVRQALTQLFFNEKDETTKAFRFRLEIPEDEVEVNLRDDDPAMADVRLRAIFHERDAGVEKLWWDARVSGSMRKDEGTWRLYRTQEVNHEDRGNLR
ncbi:MAG: hypothetical protein GY711_24840 [bacterium]|nr:hypothetical protein [bacterium]